MSGQKSIFDKSSNELVYEAYNIQKKIIIYHYYHSEVQNRSEIGK